MTPAGRILLVEDNPADAVLVQELLAEVSPAVHMEWLTLLSTTLERLDAATPHLDAVLLDLSLPDSKGLDTFRRAFARSPHTPIVVLTGLDDQMTAIDALRGGAQDYLIKGEIDALGLDRSIRYAIERKMAAEEIRRLNAELERRVAERTAELEAANKELEAFAYSVSHDLRAPLRAIDGFSQMVVDDAGEKLSEADLEHLQRVRAGAQRMAVLIDELLGLSRATRQEMLLEEVDLTALAEAVLAELAEAEPGRAVETYVAPGLTATADAALLRAVLVNLLSNAWKFTSKHDTARIEVGVTDVDGKRAFFVRDDGAGFDAAHATHLFGAFQRMHEASAFEGDGIGLATVQRLITRHGGRVWAEAEVEKGATFYFTLSRRREWAEC